MSDVYLVARGSRVAVVAGQELALGAGDMLVVEPGEDHTFVSSSQDYLHFVLQAPFVKGDKVEVKNVSRTAAHDQARRSTAQKSDS